MAEQALRSTPLEEVHQSLGATFTDFAGWNMPVRYGSDLAEHAAVRERAGLFDLSHMGEIHLRGPEAPNALDQDRKSTRLNSSHVAISYAVFCLKKKNKTTNPQATTF